MPEPFCKLEPKNRPGIDFVEAVKSRDAERLRGLLSDHPELKEEINQNWFAFDSPAMVFANHDRPTIEVLLEFGADIQARSGWWAGSFGVLDGVDSKQAEFLIERGAKLDIHSASALGMRDAVSRLIAADRDCVNQRGGDGQTPLHFATLEVVNLLLENGADPNVKCLDHSATAAQYAVDNPAKCFRLLEAGAAPDVFMAAALGDWNLAQQIIAAEPAALSSRVGGCPHTAAMHEKSDRHIYFWKMRSASTPLQIAREFRHNEIYQQLFAISPPQQQFIAACWDADAEVVKKVITQHPQIFETLDEKAKQALADAAWQGNLAAVKTMLEFGFDPHLPGPENSTPLDRAAFHGHHEIVELLLKLDPNPPLEFKNIYGGTPLGCCLYGSSHSWKWGTNHLATARALIEAGSKIDPSWIPHENKDLDSLLRAHC